MERKYTTFDTKIRTPEPYDDPDDVPPELVGTSVDPIFANGQLVDPPPTNGHVPPADKHLADVREQSRKWIYDVLTATDAPPAKRLRNKSFPDDVPVRVASFEC